MVVGLRRPVIGEVCLAVAVRRCNRTVAGAAASEATTAPRAESRFSHRGTSTQSQIAMIAR